ncbi:MAG: hypothetical protein BGO51_06205 [Rhodospirillales bacterium 69-11]|nr:MAG: hypothetical protein BGO51_06205 [Rhodospirillales bacterium 69-11]
MTTISPVLIAPDGRSAPSSFTAFAPSTSRLTVTAPVLSAAALNMMVCPAASAVGWTSVETMMSLAVPETAVAYSMAPLTTCPAAA